MYLTLADLYAPACLRILCSRHTLVAGSLDVTRVGLYPAAIYVCVETCWQSLMAVCCACRCLASVVHAAAAAMAWLSAGLSGAASVGYVRGA